MRSAVLVSLSLFVIPVFSLGNMATLSDFDILTIKNLTKSTSAIDIDLAHRLELKIALTNYENIQSFYSFTAARLLDMGPIKAELLKCVGNANSSSTKYLVEEAIYGQVMRLSGEIAEVKKLLTSTQGQGQVQGQGQYVVPSAGNIFTRPADLIEMSELILFIQDNLLPNRGNGNNQGNTNNQANRYVTGQQTSDQNQRIVPAQQSYQGTPNGFFYRK